jgi:hypothetical protein
MLTWFAPLTLLILIAGLNNLLPGQTVRHNFPNNDIKFAPPIQVLTAADVTSQLKGGTPSAADNLADSWFEWLRPDLKTNPGEFLALCIQDKPFEDNYNEFAREMSVSEGFIVVDRVAFLYINRGSAALFEPQYRQIKFRAVTVNGNVQLSNTLDIRDPDKGEKVLLLARMKKTGANPAPELNLIYSNRAK